jgi:hypothetical protein
MIQGSPDEARGLQTEANNVSRKYKELALMICVTNLIGQSSMGAGICLLPATSECP